MRSRLDSKQIEQLRSPFRKSETLRTAAEKGAVQPWNRLFLVSAHQGWANGVRTGRAHLARLAEPLPNGRTAESLPGPTRMAPAAFW